MFNLSIRILVTKSSADNIDRLLSKEKSMNMSRPNRSRKFILSF